MRFVTYTATPGLERFAERDRFGLWCSIHKRLMRTDPEYRNRVRRHRLTILGTTIPFCLATTLGLGHLGLPKFVELTLYLVMTVVYAVYVLHTSLSTQKFQNEKVGKALSEYNL